MADMKTCHFLLLCVFISQFLLSESQQCRFGAGCTFPCHCEGGDECNKETGDCSRGCANHQPGFWTGPACQIGNVAYGKTASQSGYESENTADLSVDGYTNQNFNAGRHCSLPGRSGGKPTYWQVDLGQEHVVYNVTVLTRNDCCEDHMWPGRWYVRVGLEKDINKRELCVFVDGYNNSEVQYDSTQHKFNLKCRKPLRGRYISIQKDHSETKNLYLCEVFVFGFMVGECSSGWGAGCQQPCNCESLCDAATGFCSSDCSPGWRKNYLGICEDECENGKWGKGCSQECRCWDQQEVCQKVNGYCASGCQKDFTGTGCNLSLPRLSSRPWITSATSMSVKMEFQQWDNHMGGDVPPISYSIQYRISGKVDWIEGEHVSHTGNGESQHLVQDGLQPDTEYEFQVVPVTADSRSGSPSQIERHRTTQTTITKKKKVPTATLP